MSDLTKYIRTIPNYPKEGIMFRDITTLLKDPTGFKLTIDQLANKYRGQKIDVIAGIEARGFILGAALAYNLGLGFIPIRKKGKLPGKTVSQSYELEYGTDTIEIHDDALEKGARVLLIDDLIATGGTALGAITLIEKIGGIVHETAFIVDLQELKYSLFAILMAIKNLPK
jgi:adenine phosphoribosyltransferase